MFYHTTGFCRLQIATTLHVLLSQLSVSVTRIHNVEDSLRAGYVAHKTEFKLPRIGSLKKEHREDHRKCQSWAAFRLT